MKKKNLPILIVVLLIFLVGAAGIAVYFIQKYTPTEDRMDASEYYGVGENASEIPLIFGTEILEQKGICIDQEVFVSRDVIAEYFNKRFYWDSSENILIYTTPTEKYTIEPGTNVYTINDKEQGKEEYSICEVQGDTTYVNIKYVQKFTDIEYNILSDPVRLVVQYQWEDIPVVEVKKDQAPVRCSGGIKSEILTNVPGGTKLRLVKEFEEWDQVVTEDGFIGFIAKKDLAGASAVMTFDRKFEEPEYTSQRRDFKINLAWHQVTSEAANETFDDAVKNMTGVNVISPTWFSVSDNAGNLSNYAVESYVTNAHAKGLEVWGLVDNFNKNVDTYKLLSNSSSRVKLENNLIQQALRFDLEGINIDFESLSEETGPHFIQFLRELSILCRANKLVLSVDNPVPENNYTSHYDRESQGEVVDYVIIMGYDEHYYGSEKAGSVASLPWAEKGVTDTLKEVPAEKVINGIPFYTRLWKTSAGIVTSEAIGMDAADEVIRKYKVETYWDKDYSQNYGKYEVGNDLYQIWLEDEKSIAAKMELIKKYNLAGVAEWKLGFERSSIWKVIADGLK